MTQNRRHHLALLAVLIAAVLGGATSVFSKIALGVVPPIPFNLIRFTFAGIFLFPFLVKHRPKIDSSFTKLVLISLIATANVTLFAFGIRMTTATVSQMLYAGVPIFVAIISNILLGQSINTKKWIGIIIGFFGVLAIILSPVIGTGSIFQGEILGNLLICIAMLSFAFYSVLSKPLQKKFTPLQLTGCFILTTILSQIILSIPELHTITSWSQQLSMYIIFSMGVSLIGTVIYYLLYQYAIKNGSPIVASLTLYIQPIATTFWAIILLGETISVGFVIGALITFIGVIIVTRS